MHAKIYNLQSNDHLDWQEFVDYQSPDPFDDAGWFHVTVGASGMDGGNDFQVYVATPRAVGRVKRSGEIPGILVDQFDAESVRAAIYERIESIEGCTWEQIVEKLRRFMRWEFEGMAGS